MGDAPHTPLRQIRLAAGRSLREVEILTGINRGRLSIIERGVPPTEEEARKILAALQVEVLPKGDAA
jgi:transcriptional regulator with XRE-family HTH domain